MPDTVAGARKYTKILYLMLMTQYVAEENNK